MRPFFKSNFFKFCALILALVAVSTPFWLFNSDQSVVKTNLQQRSNVAVENTTTTGTIDLNKINQDKNEEIVVVASKNEIPTQTQKLEEPTKKTEIKTEKAVDIAQQQTTNKSQTEQKISSDSKVQTNSLQPDKLKEDILATKEELKAQEKNLTLAQKVKALTEAQTKEQKAQYQRSIEERQEMVDAAISSIAQNSTMYLPPLISSRALVVTFSVPVANAQLLANQDHGVDVTTGATLIKQEQKVEGAMAFIARNLSQEAGSDLYYITPTIIYPKTRKKLYDFALDELTDKKYPELTDDVPLDLDKYDTIYLCYPIWWDDMPAAVYSFLIKYDLSDKNIVPVCLHSGDEFASTINSIITYEPHAIVYKNGLSISTKDSLNSSYITNKIKNFLINLSTEFN